MSVVKVSSEDPAQQRRSWVEAWAATRFRPFVFEKTTFRESLPCLVPPIVLFVSLFITALVLANPPYHSTGYEWTGIQPPNRAFGIDVFGVATFPQSSTVTLTLGIDSPDTVNSVTATCNASLYLDSRLVLRYGSGHSVTFSNTSYIKVLDGIPLPSNSLSIECLFADAGGLITGFSGKLSTGVRGFELYSILGPTFLDIAAVIISIGHVFGFLRGHVHSAHKYLSPLVGLMVCRADILTRVERTIPDHPIKYCWFVTHAFGSVASRLAWIVLPLMIMKGYRIKMGAEATALILFGIAYLGAELADALDGGEISEKVVRAVRLAGEFGATLMWVRFLIHFQDPERAFLKWFVLVCSAVSWLAFWIGAIVQPDVHEGLSFFLNSLVDPCIGVTIGWFTVAKPVQPRQEAELSLESPA
jgi:hypothetical protein